MRKQYFFWCWLSLLMGGSSYGQTMEDLREQIVQVLHNKSATVGVAIQILPSKDTLMIHSKLRVPMQSVYKFHVALAVLHQVDLGVLSLQKRINISEAKVKDYRHLYSPLCRKYLQGTTLTLAEVLSYAVAQSDNLACDILFELVGGPKAVQTYIHQLGIKEVAILHTEKDMQANWQRQFENWTTASAANRLLALFFENKKHLLSKESHSFLWRTLKATETGKTSLRGMLPKQVVLAHKTGHSGKNAAGITGAVNDIGVLFFSASSYAYISVFVSNSKESDTTNEKIIASIAKLTYDYLKKQ